MEEWKQNWDKIFMDKVRRERRKREKMKCHEMFTDRKG
jgi:hypothetical protein